jgi:hypothetical protein
MYAMSASATLGTKSRKGRRSVSVMSVQTWDVKPGRREEFVGIVRELKTILQRLGVNFKSIRLYRAYVAGPSTGIVELAIEYADLASWGATVDAEHNDPAWQTLAATVSGPDGAATQVSRSLSIEMPL